MTRLQKKAARIILGKYDVASKKLFADLNWLDFANRIKFHKCILIFKIVNGLSPPYLQDLFRQIKSSSTYSLRSAEEENLLLPGANSKSRSNFLVYVYRIAYHLISKRVKVLAILKKNARHICLIVKILHFNVFCTSH